MASLKSTAFSMGTGRIIVSPDVMTLEDVRALAILWAFTPSRLAAGEIKDGWDRSYWHCSVFTIC